MFSFTSAFSRTRPALFGSHLIVSAAVFFATLFVSGVTHAGSATWRTDPQDSLWNNSANWSPLTVPDGSGDVATFQPSNVTSISLGASIALDSAVFPDGIGAFTINLSPGMTIGFDGAGVVNETSDETSQSFLLSGDAKNGEPAAITFSGGSNAGQFGYYQLTGGELLFSDTSSASGSTIDAEDDSVVSFASNSSAGTAYLNVFPSSAPGNAGGQVVFMDDANAGSASVTALGARGSGLSGGSIVFQDMANAAASTVQASGGYGIGGAPGQITFQGISTAAQSFIFVYSGQNGAVGGQLYFTDDSNGDSAYVVLSGKSTLDISGHIKPGVTLGALSTEGQVYLGANNLTEGALGYYDVLTGGIHDGGVSGGGGGSLTKVGAGTLSMSAASTYRGGTVVSAGELTISNAGGSATGFGPVQIQPGAVLSGNGFISGAVTILGSGSSLGVLEAGDTESVETLTIRNRLFIQGGEYECTLDRDSVTADTVAANGVQIRRGTFNLIAIGATPLPVGATFTVIRNTSPTPIRGAFMSLPEGAVIQLSNPPNNLQVSYKGGDGNDMTLTVVP